MQRFKLLLAGLAGLFTVAAASPALADGRHGYDGYRPYATYGYRDAWRARRFDAHRRWWQLRNRYRPYGYRYDYAPGYYNYGGDYGGYYYR